MRDGARNRPTINGRKVFPCHRPPIAVSPSPPLFKHKLRINYLPTSFIFRNAAQQSEERISTFILNQLIMNGALTIALSQSQSKWKVEKMEIDEDERAMVRSQTDCQWMRTFKTVDFFSLGFFYLCVSFRPAQCIDQRRRFLFIWIWQFTRNRS